MADDRSPAEIEREIEAERAALASSLEELQAQFTPENLVNQATSYFRQNGGDFTTSLTRQVRENPMAATMVGVGVAWLISGTPKFGREGTRTERLPSPRPARSAQPQPSVDYDRRSYEPVGGLNPEPQPYAGFDDRLREATDPSPGFMERASAKLGDWADDATDAADDIADDARRRFARMKDGVTRDTEDDMTDQTYRHDPYDRRSDWSSDDDRSSAWRDWQNSASAGMADARARARRMQGRAYARSSDLMARMSEGTEGMSEGARARVMQARQGAYRAQRQMEDAMDRYSSQGRDMYDRQPLVGGLLALGLGAAIGSMLPRTEGEDRMLGSYRDRAFDEAEAIFSEESRKLKAVASAAMDEAKNVASETMESAKSSTPSGQEAVDTVETKARSAAERVADRAKTEAEKQDLGGSVKS
ncbi:MAG: DUF3618 domain-containing protein [Jannaschia sp.]